MLRLSYAIKRSFSLPPLPWQFGKIRVSPKIVFLKKKKKKKKRQVRRHNKKKKPRCKDHSGFLWPSLFFLSFCLPIFVKPPGTYVGIISLFNLSNHLKISSLIVGIYQHWLPNSFVLSFHYILYFFEIHNFEKRSWMNYCPANLCSYVIAYWKELSVNLMIF